MLLIGWIFGFARFHVTAALMDVLPVVALISLVLHPIRGPRTA